MYKVILAFRYLLRRRITWLALVSVALCVFVVIVVMTVMAGLVGDFKAKNHTWVGDCVVATDSLVGFPYYGEFMALLEGQEFVEGASGAVVSHCVLTAEGSEQVHSAEIMGIDLERHCKVTGFGQTLHYHAGDCLEAFRPSYGPNLPGCVLGIDFAMNRDSTGNYFHPVLTPVKAFSINCFPLTARGTLARGDIDVVQSKTFYFSDTSQSGVAKVDGAYVYIPLEDAQALCGMDGPERRVSAIHLKFAKGVTAEEGRDRVAELWRGFISKYAGGANYNLLKDVRVEDWKTYRRETIAAVETEEIMMSVIFGMLGVIAIFIVFVVFYMIISHKSKDIGILRSIGVDKVNVLGLFLGFALLVGAIGSGAGMCGGLVFLNKINAIEKWLDSHGYHPLWDRQMYMIGDIPNKVEVGTLVVTISAAIMVCLVGALIPSWQAARKEPVQALQVNQL
jgi:lipoprotein-releasing system permease protein